MRIKTGLCRIEVALKKVSIHLNATFLAIAILSLWSLPVEQIHAQSNAEAGIVSFKAIEKSRGLPVRGTSQAKVLNKYGEPKSRVGAVGQPPISRWIYNDFTVYFEYKHVITTVAKQDHLPTKLVGIQ